MIAREEILVIRSLKFDLRKHTYVNTRESRVRDDVGDQYFTLFLCGDGDAKFSFLCGWVVGG